MLCLLGTHWLFRELVIIRLQCFFLFLSGHETAFGTETPRPHQPVPGRTQGPDGCNAAGRGREREQAGEGRHIGVDGAPFTQAEAAQRAWRRGRGRRVRGQVSRRFRALRHRGVQLSNGRCPRAAR